MGSARRLGVPDARTGIVLLLGALVGAVGLWDGIHRAPVERELGMSQKIFYLHAPLGMWTIALAVVAAGAAAWYLWRRSPRADLLCESCVEVSLVGCFVVLATGSLWARPAWGDWFPWGEPRVTSMLVLFLIWLAYVVLRSSVEEPGRRARFSCVLAVVGAADALLAYFAIHIWNTTHPRIISTEGVALQADMARAFWTCVVAMGLLTWALVEARYRVAVLRADLESARERVLDLLEAR